MRPARSSEAMLELAAADSPPLLLTTPNAYLIAGPHALLRGNELDPPRSHRLAQSEHGPKYCSSAPAGGSIGIGYYQNPRGARDPARSPSGSTRCDR